MAIKRGVVGTAEGAAYLIRLRRRHTANVRQQLHHLFLPDDDSVATLQRALLQRVVVVP